MPEEVNHEMQAVTTLLCVSQDLRNENSVVVVKYSIQVSLKTHGCFDIEIHLLAITTTLHPFLSSLVHSHWD
jgi:uncharacterized beta-barrel protein YwiB (DUF1934 family)